MPKRKRDGFDDSDDEEPLLGRQILPVAVLPEDFDETPVDGMQYLFTVRRDAKRLPHVTRVANPYESQTSPAAVPPHDDLPKREHTALPSEEWRALFVKRFTNFRRNVDVVQELPPVGCSRLMPDKRERDLWWAFLMGRPESHWNPPKSSKQKNNAQQHKGFYRKGMRGFSDGANFDAHENNVPQETWHINDEGEVELALRIDPSELLPTPSGTPAPPDSDSSQPVPSANQSPQGERKESVALIPREPTPILLRNIDHRMSLHLLMYFTHWTNVHLKQPELASTQITETHARWIFALLSRVEDHISADDMSLLRNLARASLALLKEVLLRRPPVSDAEPSTKEEGDEKIVVPMSECSCWMIVTAVAGVWGQRDLWGDAEAMLEGLEA